MTMEIRIKTILHLITRAAYFSLADNNCFMYKAFVHHFAQKINYFFTYKYLIFKIVLPLYSPRNDFINNLKGIGLSLLRWNVLMSLN